MRQRRESCSPKPPKPKDHDPLVQAWAAPHPSHHPQPPFHPLIVALIGQTDPREEYLLVRCLFGCPLGMTYNRRGRKEAQDTCVPSGGWKGDGSDNSGGSQD
ncbi:hypothetical protein BY996DRAFT_6571003 [Phakopsora pachyrhizi]|nr:hypothetical protein BY996DRAFT_6571003 [Phakopsora pachyrhizi]